MKIIVSLDEVKKLVADKINSSVDQFELVISNPKRVRTRKIPVGHLPTTDRVSTSDSKYLIFKASDILVNDLKQHLTAYLVNEMVMPGSIIPAIKSLREYMRKSNFEVGLAQAKQIVENFSRYCNCVRRSGDYRVYDLQSGDYRVSDLQSGDYRVYDLF
jgi:hypothetical protein